jgi:hypothetical protein
VSSAQERRNRSNLYTLSGALLASFAVVLIIVILAIRPDPMTRAEVDWSDVHASAPNPQTLVNPQFTDADGDWWSNRAEYIGGDSIEWYIGFVSPTNGFVVVHEFLAGVSPEVAEVLDDVTASPVVIDGSTWTRYDRSALDNPGNYRTMYEIALPGGAILIVSGTADSAEIELVATRALDSLSIQPTGEGK